MLKAKTPLFVFTDGGSSGNPGPGAVGVVIKKEGETIKGFGQYLGETTNNVAEYRAVVIALQWLKNNYPLAKLLSWQIIFFLDSKLVVNQLNGLFKVKDAKLRNLIVQVGELEREIGGDIRYQHIAREKNQEADSLVKQVLSRR